MAYTVKTPHMEWLGESKVNTLLEAIRLKMAWAHNQNAHAIILNDDGYIVSVTEQLAEMREATEKLQRVGE